MADLKKISLTASMVLLCIMQEMKDGRAVIEKDDEKITLEQIDDICNLGEALKITRDFVHEGRDFSTSVSFIIADDGQLPYRYENNRGTNHIHINVHPLTGEIVWIDEWYQDALRNFTNTWLLEMKDIVNLNHISDLMNEKE